ncbi:hypothetical protein EYR41_004681 [Orbilia oligospora]|uniref:Uncharacterized protein n=1 Tax=Orbilia oligospora TaxID=2813651 RepID=A0A8H2HY18_ORBOL|nr:hypothetical protein EYR41_004681 [Orbilia oligospora]
MVSGTGQKDFKNEGQVTTAPWLPTPYSKDLSFSGKTSRPTRAPIASRGNSTPPKPVEAQQKALVWTPRRFSEVSIRLLCCGEGVALAVAISALDINSNFRVFLSGS